MGESKEQDNEPCLRLELVPVAGSDINDVSAGLVRLAKELNVVTFTEFSGVHLHAYPGDDPGKSAEFFRMSMQGGA